MKTARTALWLIFATTLLTGKAYAFGWTCGDPSYVRLDVLDTPTHTQVGMLYGNSLDEGHWLGNSDIALQCGRGGSSGATLLVCRSVSDKSPLTLTIYRGEDGPYAYVTSPMGQGDVTFTLPCGST